MPLLAGSMTPLVMGTLEEEEPDIARRGTMGAEQLMPVLEEQLPLPEEPQPELPMLKEEIEEAVPPVSPLVPAEPPEEAAQQGRLLVVWLRLQQLCDEHGMCTLVQLVTPEVFNRRAVASCFGSLLRLHKRGMVHLNQEEPYGPVTIEMRQEEEGTPPMPMPMQSSP
ncbi:uncharacterized protein LOC144101321 [Amblyomma americanum]